MQPKAGLVFRHRRVLDENNKPAAYVVTRVAIGTVWYKQPRERKATECCGVDEFDRVCLPENSALE